MKSSHITPRRLETSAIGSASLTVETMLSQVILQKKPSYFSRINLQYMPLAALAMAAGAVRGDPGTRGAHGQLIRVGARATAAPLPCPEHPLGTLQRACPATPLMQSSPRPPTPDPRPPTLGMCLATRQRLIVSWMISSHNRMNQWLRSSSSHSLPPRATWRTTPKLFQVKYTVGH